MTEPSDPSQTERILAKYRDVSVQFSGPLATNGFFNLGYWDPPAHDLNTACEQLVDQLVGPVDRGVKAILDVACGEGGTTRALAERFPEAQITGVNISPEQLDAARARAPGCTFWQMDAVDLDFADGSFDLVYCSEAAFHFDPRSRFLAEAFRVLRPDGWLITSDIVFSRARVSPTIPEVNFLADIDAYREMVTAAGFDRLTVRDERARTVGAFNEFAVFARLKQAFADPTDSRLRSLTKTVLECAEWHLTIDHYLLVSARKPG